MSVGEMRRGKPVSEAAAEIEARILGQLQANGWPTQTYNKGLHKPSPIERSAEFGDMSMDDLLELSRDDPKWFGSSLPSGDLLFIVMYGNCWRVQPRQAAAQFNGTLDDAEACQAIIAAQWRLGVSEYSIGDWFDPATDQSHHYDTLWRTFEERIFNHLPADWNLSFHVIKDWAEANLVISTEN